MNKNTINTFNKYIILCIILLASVVLTACEDGSIDVSRLMEEPLEYSLPLAKSIDDDLVGVNPEILPEYMGMYLDIKPTSGAKLRINNVEILPQLLLQAEANPLNRVDEDFKIKFDNIIKIYTDSNHEVMTLEIASDQSPYARLDKDSPVFRIPEYAYYVIEAALWQVGNPSKESNVTNDTKKENEITCSLVEPLVDFSPDEGVTKLELRVPHDIKTMLYSMYGYTENIFINYEIFSMIELKQRVKIYVLLSYEGYDIIEDFGPLEEDVFYPRYREIIPIQMVYSWVQGGFWALTDIKFTEYNDDDELNERNIRAILPYEDTKKALEKLDDTSNIEDELRRQALNYLSSTSRGDIQVEEKK